MKEHDGEIFVESGPGKGASFTLRLPVRNYTDYLLVEEEEELKQEPPDGLPSRKGRPVLVVDDEELVTMLISGILEGEGYSVDYVSNGEEALPMIKKGGYSFIVCNIKMPQMNGKEFYRRVMEIDPELAGKVLFMTGDPSSETLDFISGTGNRFFPKPFKIDEFKEAIKEFEQP